MGWSGAWGTRPGKGIWHRMAQARAFAKETESNFVHAYVPPSPRLQPPRPAPILVLPGATRTMAINAPVIDGSDPGAVPGGSTKTPVHCGQMGPKQDRRTFKEASFRSVRYHRYRSKITVANDNRAPVALAA